VEANGVSLSECVVLHSTPAWGGQHAELEAEATGKVMLQEFGRLAGLELSEPAVVSVHRWRYAEPQGSVSASEVAGELHEAALGICGDWVTSDQDGGGCCGVETAWLSGINAAGRVLRGLRRENQVQQGLFEVPGEE